MKLPSPVAVVSATAVAIIGVGAVCIHGQSAVLRASVQASPGRLPGAKPAEPVKRGWTPPRTPWGDPDLEGLWPGTDFVGVPLQRPEGLGTRNELTDAEFATRLANFQKQSDEDNADFDIDKLTPEQIARGTVGATERYRIMRYAPINHPVTKWVAASRRSSLATW